MKLARIGELSKGNKHFVFNNIGHIIDFDFLLDCFKTLDGKKALGVDGISKEVYREDLTANISELLIRIRRGTYRPRAARMVFIPKEDGSQRPLAISCFEDKIVQLAVSRILESIFEHLFLDCSFGYRPKRNAHDALRALQLEQQRCWKGAVVEIDLQKYFNSVPHEPLLKLLQSKLMDSRFIALIKRMIEAPLQNESGEIEQSNLGVPQGSILSPVLSNIYLHYVLDEWFESIKSSHLKGNCTEIRFADDVVFVFQYAEQGVKVLKVLPKRLAKYGLTLNTSKSSYQRCGKAIVEEHWHAKRPMPQFKFVGFKVLWRRARTGHFRPMVKPRSDRMQATLSRIRKYLRSSLNHPNHMYVLRQVSLVYRGWVNYFGVSDCRGALFRFRQALRILVHRWFNRRGKRGAMNWERLHSILENARLDKLPPLKSLWIENKTILNSGA
jgi:RNA-directed DNA polymerase